MVSLPIRNLVTRQSASAYTAPNGSFVKTLGSGSAFRIEAIQRVSGVVWVQSGVGDWYKFLSGLFRCACHRCGGRDSRVMIWPQKPSPYWGPTLATRTLYSAARRGGDNAYDWFHSYGIV